MSQPKNGADGPRVVFIAGTPRSGSTLLGNAIGEMQDCFHAGELSFILGQFDGSNRICGCGQTIDECARGVHGTGGTRSWCPRICGCGRVLQRCDFWEAVQSEAFSSGPSRAELAELGRFTATGMRYRPRSLLGMQRQSRLSLPVGSVARRYAEALGSIYLAVADISGANVIVDSSKLAMHVDLGAHFADVPAHIIHLVRDPRALAHNWDRRNNVEGISKPIRVSMHWVVSNLIVQTLDRSDANVGFTRVRYEDFIRTPKVTLEALGRQLGLDRLSLPFLDATTLQMQPNHGVAGSGSRFKTGDVKLIPDEEWRQRMSLRDRMLATLPAAPLLLSYGYSLRTTS